MRRWKYSAEDYKACAQQGMTLSETAKKMGVSRQAVHSVAAKNNINFKKKDGRGGHARHKVIRIEASSTVV